MENRIQELVADIRNKLGPFWNLSKMIADNSEHISTDANWSLWDIKREAKVAGDSKITITQNLWAISEESENKIYTEEDMLQALHQGYRNGHSDGVLYDMKDIAPEYPTFEQWLTEYKKNKK